MAGSSSDLIVAPALAQARLAVSIANAALGE